jgi:hypothetical protein
LALCVLGSTATAQQSAGDPGSALRVEVTPEGAFYRSVPRASATKSVGPSSLTTAGLIWSHPDGGLLWIGNAVSLGNYGTEVFTAYDLNNEATAVFSCYDTNPPNAIWTDNAPFGSEDHHVASANTTNTKVAIHTFNSGTASATVVLSKYTTLSPSPDWTYTFGFNPAMGGGTNCGISRDGQTIVAVAGDASAGTLTIAVFSPASNVPLSVTPVVIGAGNAIRGFDLSADGSTLYFATAGNPTAYIFDVATQVATPVANIGASFDSHAISGDGSVFAFGNFNSMSVYQKIGGVYTNTFTRNVPGQNYCAQIDISDDGNTIAAGYTFYDFYLTVRIEAIDVPSQSVTMSDTVVASGSFQNIVSAVAIAADGQHFAVGLWGDGSGPVAEERFYARNQNAAVGTVDLPGSVFGIAISADGQRMVAGSKAVHANTFGNGGSIDLWGDASPFTHFCAGDGTLATACPCGNNGLIGHGCENSATTQGALLTATGTTVPDTAVLTSSSERATAFTLFLQGNNTNLNGLVFGDGVRCVTGILKRIGIKNAVAGTAVYPGPGDPSITSRSAALGDPIAPGSTRYYQSYYRDPLASFCPPLTFNSSNGIIVQW